MALPAVFSSALAVLLLSPALAPLGFDVGVGSCIACAGDSSTNNPLARVS